MTLAGLTGNHFLGRAPFRPFLFPADLDDAGPAETFATNADAIADGAVIAFDEVEELVVGIDDDRTRRFRRRQPDDAPLELLIRFATLRDEGHVAGPCRNRLRTAREGRCRVDRSDHRAGRECKRQAPLENCHSPSPDLSFLNWANFIDLRGMQVFRHGRVPERGSI